MRKIIHVDMDCFYAAIEVRDNPTLKGKPVAIGALPEERGVLCTCNYEARQYGLHAAMATAHALRLCPSVILLPVNMPKYKAESKAIHQIFRQYTDMIEPLSLDEAYLDVSHAELCHGSATLIAQQIRRQIQQERHLTASAGVAPNKFLAKVASDWNKPNGQYVITPEAIEAFVYQLPVRKLWGVGKVTAERLSKLGIKTCGQLQKKSLQELTQLFGNTGVRLYELSRGIDERPVEPHRVRKSLSVEETFREDIADLSAIFLRLGGLIGRLEKRFEHCRALKIKTQFVKMKFHDFTQTTVECASTTVDEALYRSLIAQAYQRALKPIRLVGVGLRFAEVEMGAQQLEIL